MASVSGLRIYTGAQIINAHSKINRHFGQQRSSSHKDMGPGSVLPLGIHVVNLFLHTTDTTISMQIGISQRNRKSQVAEQPVAFPILGKAALITVIVETSEQAGELPHW